MNMNYLENVQKFKLKYLTFAWLLMVAGLFMLPSLQVALAKRSYS